MRITNAIEREALPTWQEVAAEVETPYPKTATLIAQRCLQNYIRRLMMPKKGNNTKPPAKPVRRKKAS